MAKIPGIPTEEQEAAAKYFTMSNLAVLELGNTTNIHRAFDSAAQAIESETETTIDGEHSDWKKEVKKAKPGDYCSTEWERVKKDWSY